MTDMQTRQIKTNDVKKGFQKNYFDMDWHGSRQKAFIVHRGFRCWG